MRFTKGHGTKNDFVLISDTRNELDLTPVLVRALADRRGGIGGDGVIRLVPTADVAESDMILAEDPHAIWFMDYRNADGSVAQMCGNGVRVFAAFAERAGLVSFAGDTTVAFGTRAGVKRVRREPDGWFAVDMGHWSLPGGEQALAAGYDAMVAVTGRQGVPRPALSVDMGNPHTVFVLSSEDELAAVDMGQAPVVEPVPAEGTNVEAVVPLADSVDTDGRHWGRVRMRVHERGVGETASCGTGACAAALAVRAWRGDGAPDAWHVEVPGGALRVQVFGPRVELSGPAELVFSGECELTEDGFRVVERAPRAHGSAGGSGSPADQDAAVTTSTR